MKTLQLKIFYIFEIKALEDFNFYLMVSLILFFNFFFLMNKKGSKC
jgi:hypothetical protein